jgi:aminoglycoside/choline kinase family phosphotransferase
MPRNLWMNSSQMTIQLPQDIHSSIQAIFHHSGRFPEGEACDTACRVSGEQLKGDGSNRRFWRLQINSMYDCVVVCPEKHESKELQEAQSGWKIGNHLRKAGVPVPEFFGFDEDTGLLVCEDLGDTHLHNLAINTDFNRKDSVESLRNLYRQALKSLLVMQCNGRKSFNADWCWDSPVYDRELMLNRESGYFIRAFWQGLLGMDIPDGLQSECEQLADIAAEASCRYFLHRDFQSRNIMIKDGKVRIIDYQGGRLGPLGYDLASLLLDPYANLPVWFQEELYAYYLEQLQSMEGVKPCDRESFDRNYHALALQRNLQILGAFSHLSKNSGKDFFRCYIRPALNSLRNLLHKTDVIYLPVLTSLTLEAAELLPADF